MEGDGLLVGHREDEPPAGAVLEMEDLGEVTPGLLPELGRREYGHQHFLRPDRVLLLADDLLDLAVHLPAERQVRPDACAHLADVGAANEQLVRDGLRVGWGVAQCGQEEL